eukprot:TRINITY_DN2229_c0_g1_i1.p1 TRINITY_DN2229_c0_g1~~TRINITY_DN2229_c0_g1_i1.p1  ORF type:complete len:221 (-),score=21.37 TRINITY_DN2229_c0_g1_i1:760-1422(-)
MKTNRLRIVVLGSDNPGKSDILFNFLSSTSIPCFDFDHSSSASTSTSSSTSSSEASSVVNSATSSRSASSTILRPNTSIKRRSTFSEVTKKSVVSVSNLFSRRSSSVSSSHPNLLEKRQQQPAVKYEMNDPIPGRCKDDNSRTHPNFRSRAVSLKDKRLVNNSDRTNQTRQPSLHDLEVSSAEDNSDILSAISAPRYYKTSASQTKNWKPVRQKLLLRPY